MDGNVSCLFQGKMYAPNSESISTGAQALENILFTFLSWRNYCIFSLYSCLSPGIWQRLYVVLFFKQYCNYQEQKASALHQ